MYVESIVQFHIYTDSADISAQEPFNWYRLEQSWNDIILIILRYEDMWGMTGVQEEQASVNISVKTHKCCQDSKQIPNTANSFTITGVQ